MFSKSSPDDVVVSVETPEGITVSAVRYGGDTLTKANKWGYSGGVLSLKATFLSSLEDGDAVFTVIMSNGNEVTITITIGV